MRTVPLPPPTNEEVAEVLAAGGAQAGAEGAARRARRGRRARARRAHPRADRGHPGRAGVRRAGRAPHAGHGPLRQGGGPSPCTPNVFIPAQEREGLERLCRYGARPSFSLSRSERAAGWAAGVPHAEEAQGRLARAGAHPGAAPGAAGGADPAAAGEPGAVSRSAGAGVEAAEEARAGVEPRRSRRGRAKPRNDRMDWASLFKRVYKTDVFQCGACGGRARPIAVIQDPEVVKRILRHLGLPVEAPAWHRPAGPAGATVRRSRERGDEPVDVAKLPRWMRAPGPRERKGGRVALEAEESPWTWRGCRRGCARRPRPTG